MTDYDKALVALVRIASEKHEDGEKLTTKGAASIARMALRSVAMTPAALKYQSDTQA